IVGYRVTNQVRVKVRQLEKFGEVLDKVVASGANTISGIQFSVSDAEQRLDEARRKAVENARHKAELLAKAADVMLGPPQEIREQSTSGPQPYRARNLQMAAADRSVPIESGEQTLSAQVHVTYSLTGGGDSDKAK
ncbi:MAG: SIMPL domain-containing protein, partial [Planctomycetales bacterium]|nr:SIMPL domain-containing protein [Planctomycetales bacterium]